MGNARENGEERVGKYAKVKSARKGISSLFFFFFFRGSRSLNPADPTSRSVEQALGNREQDNAEGQL